MWTTIIWIAIACIILFLGLLVQPKKQPFTCILNNGEQIEGAIRYAGQLDDGKMRAEIIAQIESKLYPDERISRILLG